MSDLAGPHARSIRISGIDVARGAAMFFVCLSHFSSNCLIRGGYRDIGSALQITSMVASPAFVLISGIILGFYFHSRRDRFHEFQFRLADRALFLLTAGHLLLGVTSLPENHYATQGFGFGYITDSIAVAALLGPMLLQRLSPARRIGLAVALLVLTWILVLLWHPRSMLGTLVESRSFGVYPAHLSPIAIFPAVPWLAVYLVGTVIGEAVARWRLAGGLRRAGTRLMLGGGLTASIIGGIKLALRSRIPSTPHVLGSAAMLLSPTQKWPPGPTYILFFGGASVAMVGAVLLIREIVPDALPVRWLGWVGESSLFVFLLQAYLFQVIPYLMGPHGLVFWLAYFALTLVTMVVAARMWQRHALNRLFTVGLPTLRRVYRRRSVSAINSQFASDG